MPIAGGGTGEAKGCGVTPSTWVFLRSILVYAWACASKKIVKLLCQCSNWQPVAANGGAAVGDSLHQAAECR